MFVLRSIGSVLAGYAVIVAAVLAFVGLASALAPAAIEARAPWLLALEAVAGVGAAIAGGLVAMRLARRAPLAHAAALAGLLLVLGALTFAMEQGQKPAWSILATVLAGPLGVALATRLRRGGA